MKKILKFYESKYILTELRIVENIFSLKINVRAPKNRHPKDIRNKTNFLVDKTVFKHIIFIILAFLMLINWITIFDVLTRVTSTEDWEVVYKYLIGTLDQIGDGSYGWAGQYQRCFSVLTSWLQNHQMSTMGCRVCY